MSQPGECPSQGQAPALDTKVAFMRLYADPRIIAYDRSSIPLDEVEWVGYHVIRRYTRGMFGIGKDVFDDTFRFQVGWSHGWSPSCRAGSVRRDRQCRWAECEPGRRPWPWIFTAGPVDRWYAAPRRHGLGLPDRRSGAGAERAAVEPNAVLIPALFEALR